MREMPSALVINLCLGNLGDQAHKTNQYEYKVVWEWLTSRMSAWPDVDGNHRACVGNRTPCIIRRSSNTTRLEPMEMQAVTHNGSLIVSWQTFANTKFDKPWMTITNTISNGILLVCTSATRHEHEHSPMQPKPFHNDGNRNECCESRCVSAATRAPIKRALNWRGLSRGGKGNCTALPGNAYNM